MRWSAIGVLAATALLAGAPAAQASDASLRATVEQQAKQLRGPQKKFVAATKNLTKAKIPKAKTATTNLINATTRYHDAVAGEHADSAKLKQARTSLLAGLRKLKSGLTKFRSALTDLQNGDNASAQSKAKSAIRIFQSAIKSLNKAQALFA
jgi:hypothetical protein